MEYQIELVAKLVAYADGNLTLITEYNYIDNNQPNEYYEEKGYLVILYELGLLNEGKLIPVLNDEIDDDNAFYTYKIDFVMENDSLILFGNDDKTIFERE